MTQQTRLPQTITVASGNNGKIREIRELLRETEIDVVSLVELETIPDIEENGKTFEENAIIKADAIAPLCHTPVLADDSGLIVDALDGAPGIYSARYGGEGLTDAQRFAHLLDNLQNVPEAQRTARFVCALVYLTPGSQPTLFEGVMEGHIAQNPTGMLGFGYDPIFIPEGYDISAAELPSREKNQISHRGKALAAFKNWLIAEKES